MNLQQLEYIVALDLHRNHARAAEACHVTQPTLTMMVKKLEEELGVKIFDRTRQPLQLTATGEIVVAKAKQIISEIKNLKEFVRDEKDDIKGEYRLGVIPTLAPYLLPRFLHNFLEHNPSTSFTVTELQTEEIIHRLKTDRLDIGILVTPLDEKDIREIPVFYEPILLYTSEDTSYFQQDRVSVKSLTADGLWLLEEGHCFRGQVMNLCSSQSSSPFKQLHYQSGSFETLKAMVDTNKGYTLIPELAINTRNKRVKHFTSPEPVREVSLVVSQNFVKEILLSKLREDILRSIPSHFKRNEKYMRVNWK